MKIDFSFSFLAACTTACLVFACDKPSSGNAHSESQTPHSSSSASAAAAAIAPASSVASSAAPSAAAGSVDPFLSIMDRLKREQQSRPHVAPTADDVFAAFGKTGVKLKEQKQHLASPIAAAYCVGAKSDDEALAMSVCEYPDEATGTAGVETSKKTFAAVANRNVWRNKATTLAIIQVKKDATSDAAEKKLVAAFTKL